MTHPTPQLDAREFIEHVVTSGLMDREELARALEGMPETDQAKKVARHLMRTGKLTKFQARRLLGGVTEGFILGQYRILEELGRGGMGHVYKAVHQTMGRFVALKLLAPRLTQTERARELFRREVLAAAKLSHPNIVTAFDASRADEPRVYLVMEYVDGPNLSQLVKEQGPLSVEQACEYVRQTAIGLDYAHNLGLIHRDVKPSNLLVQQTSGGPQIKILDFGLALVTAAEAGGPDSLVGAANTVLGTPDYTSPEQARDQYGVDRRSDLYSLGCTFFFLLTGEPPFPGGSGIDKLLRQGSEPPPAIRSKRPDIPEAVAEVVHKLLAKNPKWRYQTGGELAAELTIVLGRKAEWTTPARPAPKPRPKPEPAAELDLEGDDEPLTGSSGDDPFDHNDLDERSASTVPTGAMTTGETPAPNKRLGGRRKQTVPWVWVFMAAGLAFFFVALFGLVVRYLLQHFGQ
jgi:eukaryotic-like serine/threonine-protein kinase